MAVLEFFIPSNRKYKNGKRAPLDGINEYVNANRGGWGSSVKRKNGLHAQKCCAKAMEDEGWECPKCKCRVTLTFVEVDRRRDPDNIYGGAKFILDGLSKPLKGKKYGAGAIEDDSQEFIELSYGPILVDAENPGCMVRIETLEEHDG